MADFRDIFPLMKNVQEIGDAVKIQYEKQLQEEKLRSEIKDNRITILDVHATFDNVVQCMPLSCPT